MTRRVLAAIAVMAMAAAGCDSTPTSPVTGPAMPTGPIPTGRAVEAAPVFDNAPCVVATVEELRAALNDAFHVISGTVLRTLGKPAEVPGGCEYAFIADGTDAAEPFHSVKVLVLRLPSDGAKQLSDCVEAGKSIPYGPVEVGDSACLGPGSVMVVRNGALHFTIAVVAAPTKADRSDEDTDLAALVKAAADTVVKRLPRQE